MALFFLSLMWRLYRNTLRTPRTLRSLLDARNPERFYSLYSFSVEGEKGLEGPVSVFTKPGSDALTPPIKTANASCKRRLEDAPH